MSIDKKFIEQFISVTSKAALAASFLVGKNDKIAADKAAVDSMRTELNNINMTGEVVIGEGALDEAPLLYTGEILGTKNGPNFDIAVDPVEGTNFVANNLPGGLTVLAVAEKGNLFNAPETYMDKLAVGKEVPKDATNLDFSIEKNIKNIAEAKNKDINKITACILDRPRHKKFVEILKKMNVNINFITDGDVAGAISVADPNSPNDIYIGIGGGPEGVLAAAALSCLGGQIQTRLSLDNLEEKRAKLFGIHDFKKKYNINDMIKGDVIFSATGVTDGDLLKGIIDGKDSFTAHTFALHKSLKINKKVTNIHKK